MRDNRWRTVEDVSRALKTKEPSVMLALLAMKDEGLLIRDARLDVVMFRAAAA